ncbi:HlyD family efflux transporter periplasmic adaptor subunit [Sulfitobacter sp. 1151]|uniref:HlyD family efflux transporter periplasmic adaptor subunit n=2 Tax=Parasulfitobacter algicola TaxID=2614809 RepID=A0ABX2IWD4_9RHOB|nr:HlyD family efflux transporter periplasmic adaptor subunit [Sulfitobacter algicola]
MRLAARREGLIAEVMVTEGIRVQANQPLARIDDTAARLQLGIARDELRQTELSSELASLRAEQAQAEAARLAPLADADAIPARQADEALRAADVAALEARSAVLAIELARQRVAQQEQEVEAHVIRAPIAGLILRSSARVGDGTSTSTITEMFLLAPDAPRVVRADLDEQFVGLVEPGQRAEILLERGSGESLAGEVLRVAAVFGTPGQTAGTDARTIQIVVRIDEDPGVTNRLILGQRMIVRVLR